MCFHTSPFGTHLDREKTIDEELEKKNFKGAGEVLANLWGKLVLEELVPIFQDAKKTGRFIEDVWRRLAIETLVPKQGYTSIPDDLYLPSFNKNQVQKRICKSCDIYFTSMAAHGFER